MATGTTFDHLRKRNAIVEAALRRVGAIKPGESPGQAMMRDAIRDLNDIVREEDQDLTGDKAVLWARSSRHLFLEADHRLYAADAEDPDSIPTDMLDLLEAYYRDDTGEDTRLKIYSPRDRESLSINEHGDPRGVILNTNIVLASQTLYVWPIPSDDDVSAGDTFGTVSEVTGTDGEFYDCIAPHESSAQTRPITGPDYALFWQMTGTTGATWVTATDYTTAKSVRVVYKRPLFDFDGPGDDPDMPLGWSSYLMWRLCINLASTEQYKVSDSTYTRFMKQLEIASAKLFPSKMVKTTEIHNKARYF